MRKKDLYKKILFGCIVTALATNCGGGGGGGGGGATAAPVKPTTSTATRVPTKGNTEVNTELEVRTENVISTINDVLVLNNLPALPDEIAKDLPQEVLDEMKANAEAGAKECFDKLMANASFRRVVEDMINSSGNILLEDNEEMEATSVKPESVEKHPEINAKNFMKVLTTNLNTVIGMGEELIAKVIPNDKIAERIPVGVIDGKFVHELVNKYENLEIIELEAPKVEHAEKVFEVLNEKQFDIKAVSLKEEIKYKDKEGEEHTWVTMSASKKMYSKLFEKLSQNPEDVKVINQSWGTVKKKYSNPEEDSDGIGEDIQQYLKEQIETNNALFVWANGNREKNAKNTGQSKLPKKIKELEKGWLTVIGVNPNGKQHYRDHYAYADEETKKWAISANGNSQRGTSGSSFAAPRVTRAAALVASKYDWMTNSQVRQTLLTTTDTPGFGANIRYKGDPTKEYGWGYLNEATALKGPGAFYKDLLAVEGETMFVANIPQGRITAFENDIHGDAGLIKSGEGRLLLKGNMTYKQPTFIEKGILDVYKQHDSDILISHNGTLVLHDNAKVGKAKGTLVNVGRVKLGEADANVTINGNLKATGNSWVVFGGNSKVHVSGNAELGNLAIEDKEFPLTGTDFGMNEISSGRITVLTVEGELKDSLTALQEKIRVNGMRQVEIIQKEKEKELQEMKKALEEEIKKTHEALEAKDKEEQDKLAEALAKVEVELIDNKKEEEEIGDVAIEPEENQKPPQPPMYPDFARTLTIDEGTPVRPLDPEEDGREFEENVPRHYTASYDNGDSVTEIYFVTTRKNAVEYFGKEGAINNVAESFEKIFEDFKNRYTNVVAKGPLADRVNELEDGNTLLEALEMVVNATPQQLQEASKRMSGEIYATAQSLTFKQAETVNRNLSNHLGDLRAFRNSGYDWQGWYTGFGSKGNLSKKGYANADTDLRGTQFGLDRKVTPSTQVGVSMDYSYATADFDRYAGNFKSNGLGVSLYGKKYFKDDSYVLGRVGAARYTTKVKRELMDRNLKTQTGDIKHNDVMLSTYVEAGKHYRYFTPFVGYSYDNLRRGSFAENNAEWGIIADAKNYEKSTVVLGVRGEYEIADYRLNSHITHEVNVGKRDLNFEGRFAVADTKVEFKGIEQKRSTTWVGVGVGKDITPQFSVDVKADMKFDEKKKAEILGSVGFNYRF